MKPKCLISLCLAVALTLASVQQAAAGYAVCIKIAAFVVGAGVYSIRSCNPAWRCWGVPIDEEQPWLGMSTNFPSQILYRSGRASGWVTARNITFKTRDECLARGCTTNNLTPADVALEEWLTVEEGAGPDGPWTFLRNELQSPDDLDIQVTNSAPRCFYRVTSTNDAPVVSVQLRVSVDSAPSQVSNNGNIPVKGCYCDPDSGWFRSGPLLTVGDRYLLRNKASYPIYVLVGNAQDIGAIAPHETRDFHALDTWLIVVARGHDGEQVRLELRHMK